MVLEQTPIAHPSHEHSSNGCEGDVHSPARLNPILCPSTETPVKRQKKKAGPLYLALFIQEVQDTKFCLNEVYAGLVIAEVYQSPRDFLFHVLFLFQLKHMLRVGKEQR